MPEQDGFEFRRRIRNRPRGVRSGGVNFVIPRRYVEQDHELAITIRFISNRKLFGECYSRLRSEYFRESAEPRGIFLLPIVPTDHLCPGQTKPGDVDLLAVPYEGDEIDLRNVMAMEVKVIRARFQKQGRSPNDLGLSQAKSLLDRGFPRVALAHLIVADESPEEAWREVGVAQILDEEDHVEMLEPQRIDLMPFDLMRRGYGRLEARCDDDRIGLLCAYVKRAGCMDQDALRRSSVWQPVGRNAPFNESYSPTLLERVAAYFEKNAWAFLDNPAFDP